MKVLEERLLLNDLKDTLDQMTEGETLIIKRSQGRDVVVMSIEEYNKMKQEIYEAKNKK